MALGTEVQELLLGDAKSRYASERALLTERERTILQMFADGAKVADVAGALEKCRKVGR